jgi:hypothetical protein
VPAITDNQLVPLSVEYSILKFVMLDHAQVMLCKLPVFHVSPPLGEMTDTAGAATMVKTPLLESRTAAFEASLMRMSPCDVGVLGTVQGYDPAGADVLAVMRFQLLPLFVEYSSFANETLTEPQVML